MDKFYKGCGFRASIWSDSDDHGGCACLSMLGRGRIGSPSGFRHREERDWHWGSRPRCIRCARRKD